MSDGAYITPGTLDQATSDCLRGEISIGRLNEIAREFGTTVEVMIECGSGDGGSGGSGSGGSGDGSGGSGGGGSGADGGAGSDGDGWRE